MVSLVTGANGHLGNNLVRELLSRGETVRAGVRDLKHTAPFEGLHCEVVYADLLDRESLNKALEGVDVLYHVAAVHRNWAKNPVEEIIKPTIEGTKNILEAAARHRVKKIIFVSSIAALDRAKSPITEKGWNTDYSNPYAQSKTESEQLAWEWAKKNNVWMVSVLPSGIIGPHAHTKLTRTMQFLNDVLHNAVPINPNFTINYVAVKDVTTGMIQATQRGKKGSRYILANECSGSTTTVFELARTVSSDITTPRSVSKGVLSALAFFETVSCKWSDREPAITKGEINMWYKANLTFDISKAKTDLNFRPKPPEEALRETLIYLKDRS